MMAIKKYVATIFKPTPKMQSTKKKWKRNWIYFFNGLGLYNCTDGLSKYTIILCRFFFSFYFVSSIFLFACFCSLTMFTQFAFFSSSSSVSAKNWKWYTWFSLIVCPLNVRCWHAYKLLSSKKKNTALQYVKWIVFFFFFRNWRQQKIIIKKKQQHIRSWLIYWVKCKNSKWTSKTDTDQRLTH